MNALPCTTRTTCRLCGSPGLVSLFSLGDQYVSNFVEKDQVHAGARCPIEIVLCPDCSLVQQKHTAPQELLYTRHYWYVSGRNATMRAALRDVTAAIESRVELGPGDVVCDIGSNDATLLRSYTPPGLVRVGVEPANNLATPENYRGLGLAHDFWGGPVGALQNGKYFQTVIDNRITEGLPGCGTDAKVITACGMFYDLEDPNAFVRDVAAVLADDGVFVAQLMCLKNMLAMGDVGNLVAEHLLFFSLRSLARLYDNHGLQITDIEKNSVNGESYRIWARKLRRGQALPIEALERITRAVLLESDFDQPESYQKWFARLTENRDRCMDFICAEVAKGKRMWLYAASTKGNVLLQWYGLDHTLVEAAAERSPEKVGKYTVGTGIRIASEVEFRRAKPDYAFCAPYGFLDEFVDRESEWRAGGGRFIVPLPNFRVV